MTQPSLNDLVTPSSAADVLAQELDLASDLNLPTTSWEPLCPDLVFLNINATIAADTSVTINLIAQGGYASYAAQMVDDSGNEIRSWMSLIGTNNYNVSRTPATPAVGSVPLTAGAVGYGPIAANTLHFQHPTTGATYTNNQSVTLSPSATTPVQFIADAAFVGSAGTIGVGIVLVMITPLAGVTVQPLAAAAVGTDEENNAHYLARCTAKLGTLSPAGPDDAYSSVAQSIAVAPVASAVPPYAVTAVITKTLPVLNKFTGILTVYVANASGPCSSTDANVVTNAIQGITTDKTSAVAVPSTLASINVSYTAYVRASAGIESSTATSNIATALAELAASIPLGGETAGSANIVPLSQISDAIFDANRGTVRVAMTAPTGDTTIAISDDVQFNIIGAAVVLV